MSCFSILPKQMHSRANPRQMILAPIFPVSFLLCSDGLPLAVDWDKTGNKNKHTYLPPVCCLDASAKFCKQATLQVYRRMH